MAETIENIGRELKWPWYNVMGDLEKQGGLSDIIINPLSLHSHGFSGHHGDNRFYFTWLYKQFLLLTMHRFSQELVDAFSRVVEYQPFCRYEMDGLETVEWDKNVSKERFEALRHNQAFSNLRLFGTIDGLDPETAPYAVSAKEVEQFGCPYCGYRSGFSSVSGGGTTIVVCGKCEQSFAVLADGVTLSTIGFGNFYPQLVDHPRRGIPSTGRSDTRPEQGGEFFYSRGIGLDTTPGCFVCGGEVGLRSNIAAFVVGKAAGERVVAMFQQGARLDYRDHEPDRVQVKIGACNCHLPNLRQLDTLTRESDGVITREIVQTAISS